MVLYSIKYFLNCTFPFSFLHQFLVWKTRIQDSTPVQIPVKCYLRIQLQPSGLIGKLFATGLCLRSPLLTRNIQQGGKVSGGNSVKSYMRQMPKITGLQCHRAPVKVLERRNTGGFVRWGSIFSTLIIIPFPC